MIEVQIRDVDGRRVCGPVIVCDHCSERISRAEDGLYEYPVVDARCHGEIYFAHRDCAEALEDERRGGREWMRTELELLPLFIADVLGVRLPDLEARGQQLGEAGMVY